MRNDFVSFEPITGANRGRCIGLSPEFAFIAPTYELNGYEKKIKGVFGYPFDYSELTVIPAPAGNFDFMRAERVNARKSPLSLENVAPPPEKRFRLHIPEDAQLGFDLGKAAETVLAQV